MAHKGHPYGRDEEIVSTNAPQKFREILPDVYNSYNRIFNQDPVNIEMPVVDVSKQGKKI